MSFILDALRKSERERQRNSAPSLSRAPQAPQRRPTPIWTWLVIASLSVALAAVSALLFRDVGREEAATGTEATAAIRTTPTAEAASTRETASTAEAASNADVAEPPALPSEPRAMAPESQQARSATAAESAPAASETTPGSTPTMPPPKPASELARLDPTLPGYTLELLAFNRLDPASGYAWINGRRYFRGERIGQGPELLEIRADGVLLGWRGEVFLLRQR